MAIATLASRVAGFVRILVLAAALGLGTRLLDTYNIANTLPNQVYELIVGGTMASIVVPLLTRATLSEPDGGVLYAQRLLSLIIYVLSAVTLLAVAGAPLLIDLYAPGFTAEQRDLATVFSRYFLPQILFYGISATAAAILQIRGRFGTPAWAPLANSLIVIAVGLTYAAVGGSTSTTLETGHLLLLSLGTTAGVLAQMALIVAALRRTGFPLRLRLDPRGIGIRRIGRLGAWVLLAVVTSQILFAAATRAASWGGPGGITAYQNANMIFYVPYAVFAVSIMTAMLPRLSQHAARGEHNRVVTGLSRAVRTALVVTAPIATAFLLLGPQIATVLFAHGNSSTATVRVLGLVLAAFGLTLVPFTSYMILQRGLYALQETRTAALITVAVAAVGVTGCAAAGSLLEPEDIVLGIPVAYAAAYTTGLSLTAVVLRRRLGYIDGRRLLRTHARVLTAAVAGAVCAGLALWAARSATDLSAWTDALVTGLIATLAGAAGYLAAGRLLRLAELRHLLNAALPGIRTW
ncbi:murein biosynthesis integral membrane protein MurJ [Actinoplanes utahensis]|uniref:Membrane protein n=1 Tax=Actinoplanes utahensis TaxID=1869 RepID=A0A0A6X307_ACTUT|nr:murein biosynthesis integral membrane protein MurJ [Actinoplanes utahensis]KHD74497.1 membrane protein [Actinoplanes utahensis]